MALISRVVQRYLLLWLVTLSAVAYWWKGWMGGGFDPFLVSGPVIQGLIALTMLAIGSLLPPREVTDVLRRWPMVLGGTAIQYTAMPILAYVIAVSFGFDGPILLGVMMAGCVPGAMASNVLTLAARGNVSYSVSLTTSATLLSPLIVPLAMKLTIGQYVALDAWKVSLDLLLTVVLPVVVGFALARVWPLWHRASSSCASLIANLSILYIIAIVVGKTRDQLGGLSTQGIVLLVALLLINLGGYLAGNLGGRVLRLDNGRRRALTLEIGMQNAGVGTMLVLTALAKENTENLPAAIPTAMYTFGCMLTGTILAWIWAERSRREDAMLAMTEEVTEPVEG